MNRKLIPVLVLFATSGVIACSVQPSVPGGYSRVAVTNRQVLDAAAFAVKVQQKAMQNPRKGPSAKLELVDIVGAEQQVVAGMNYRLKVKVRFDGREKDAEAVVWWQAWKTPEPYQLTSWHWN